MHWKAHLFRHFRFQIISDFFSQTPWQMLSHPFKIYFAQRVEGLCMLSPHPAKELSGLNPFYNPWVISSLWTKISAELSDDVIHRVHRRPIMEVHTGNEHSFHTYFYSPQTRFDPWVKFIPPLWIRVNMCFVQPVEGFCMTCRQPAC